MKFFSNIFKADRQHLSATVLVLANLIPIFGVLIFHWSIFQLMFLFWFENLVIGVFNVLRMIVAVPFADGVLPDIPFFCVHYGLFLAGHCVFIVALFGGSGAQHPLLANLLANLSIQNVIVFLRGTIHENHLEIAALGLVASRATSFVTNYLGQREFRRITANQLFWQPYPRVITLHVALLGGAILMQKLNSPVVGLIILVALKLILDLAGHLRERRKLSAQTA